MITEQLLNLVTSSTYPFDGEHFTGRDDMFTDTSTDKLTEFINFVFISAGVIDEHNGGMLKDSI